jgi:hypothetical protein
MQWDYVIAIIIAVPVMAFPVALIWYLTIGGTVAAMKDARAHRQATANTNA